MAVEVGPRLAAPETPRHTLQREYLAALHDSAEQECPGSNRREMIFVAAMEVNLSDES